MWNWQQTNYLLICWFYSSLFIFLYYFSEWHCNFLPNIKLLLPNSPKLETSEVSTIFPISCFRRFQLIIYNLFYFSEICWKMIKYQLKIAIFAQNQHIHLKKTIPAPAICFMRRAREQAKMRYYCMRMSTSILWSDRNRESSQNNDTVAA